MGKVKILEKVKTWLFGEKDYFDAPKSVQSFIPIKRIYEDGIFLLDNNTYSRTYSFSDINYQVASEDEQKGMFIDYSKIINALDDSVYSKITINNRKINKVDFERKILLKNQNDNLDQYRDEYNKMLMTEVEKANEIVQERLITITVIRKSVEEARAYFNRTGGELGNLFLKLGSRFEELDLNERLRILHDFYRTGEESGFNFNFKDVLQKGHSFKDYICPDSVEFKSDYVKIGNRYSRIVFLKNYANFIKDSMVVELTELNKNMMLSLDILPIQDDVALKKVQNIQMDVESQISQWQERQNRNNNFSSILPSDLETQRRETKEFLDDLVIRDQKMFFGVLTMVITADTKEELESSTDTIKRIARKNSCSFGTATFMQQEGLQTVLPIGLQKMKSTRTLTTESIAVFMPFNVQEIRHNNGIYYGQNAISKNMIIINKKDDLQNGNGFILGVSGSGKSFMSKEEISSIRLREGNNADIIIIDPEREFANLTASLGGDVIKVSATSKNHINVMDLNSNYGEKENSAVADKAQFIMSICELLMGKGRYENRYGTIIDRCVKNTYKYYKQGNYMGTPPTLQDFREELLKQPEEEAKELALDIELFTNGSLNPFAQETNVNTQSSFICYDILDLGKQLLPLGMLVILDSIVNRITSNRNIGKRTYIFIDEIYLLFQYPLATIYLTNLWKRVRKYGACITGITQNVTGLLANQKAKEMLSNSELIIMMNQSASDREELSRLFNFSEALEMYITNVGIGEGLIKVNNTIIPFKNKFPRNTKLYELMSTKIEEKNTI